MRYPPAPWPTDVPRRALPVPFFAEVLARVSVMAWAIEVVSRSELASAYLREVTKRLRLPKPRDKG